MLIDWFTTVAQIVNFLILIALLRYFLYRPIVSAMEKRKQAVADRWHEAEQQREQARAEADLQRQKNRELEERREELMAQVREEVEDYRHGLLSKVRGEADQLQTRWSTAIRHQAESFLREFRRESCEQICAVARKALTDLASADLERQIVHCFLKQFETIDPQERTAIIQSIRDAGDKAVVSSAFAMPQELQAETLGTLRNKLVREMTVDFEQSAELLCGIALRVENRKVAWDLRDYLDGLEQQLADALEEEAVASESRRAAAHASNTSGHDKE